MPPSKSGNDQNEQKSNPVPYLEWEYLCQSAFLVNWTAPNKEDFRIKLAFKSCDYLSNS